MRSFLKALTCVILPFVCIGLGFAQARSGEPTPRVLTPQLVAHLPAPVPCDAKKGSCWKPTIGIEWQWQLRCDTAKTCTNLDVHVPFYVIDAVENPASTVPYMSSGQHARGRLGALPTTSEVEVMHELQKVARDRISRGRSEDGVYWAIRTNRGLSVIDPFQNGGR